MLPPSSELQVLSENHLEKHENHGGGGDDNVYDYDGANDEKTKQCRINHD